MLVVGIETSGRVGSVCLQQDDRAGMEEVFAEGLTHGRDLAPALARLLGGAGARPADIDLLSVAVGPGSYTGIRIGLVFARMLGRLAGARTRGVSSLRALACRAPGGSVHVAPVLDARWGKVYGALFAGGEEPERLSEDAIADPAAFAAGLPPDTLVFGTGAAACEAAFRSRVGRAQHLDGERISARDVARLGRIDAAADRGSDELTPRYLKPWGPPTP